MTGRGVPTPGWVDAVQDAVWSDAVDACADAARTWDDLVPSDAAVLDAWEREEGLWT